MGAHASVCSGCRDGPLQSWGSLTRESSLSAAGATRLRPGSGLRWGTVRSQATDGWLPTVSSCWKARTLLGLMQGHQFLSPRASPSGPNFLPKAS